MHIHVAWDFHGWSEHAERDPSCMSYGYSVLPYEKVFFAVSISCQVIQSASCDLRPLHFETTDTILLFPT